MAQPARTVKAKSGRRRRAIRRNSIDRFLVVGAEYVRPRGSVEIGRRGDKWNGRIESGVSRSLGSKGIKLPRPGSGIISVPTAYFRLLERSIQALENSFQLPKRYFQVTENSFQAPENDFRGIENSFQGPKIYFQALKRYFQALERYFQAVENSFQALKRVFQSVENTFPAPQRA